VTGSVPSGSGLSSSAALVVASTLAFLAVNGRVRTELLIVLGSEMRGPVDVAPNSAA
jgi:galactokinase